MAEGDPPAVHPLGQVDPAKRHELLMAERSLLVTAKADRENEMVRTIIQISSAAILIVPAIAFGKEVSVPLFSDVWPLYLGLIFLCTSLLLSLGEQYLSSIAYQKQLDVVFDYYTLNSDAVDHRASLRAVRFARVAAMASFFVAIVFSGAGVALILGEK